MTVIDIPYHRVVNLALRPVLFSSEQGGDLGNAVLPLPRVGDRMAIDVKTDRLRNDAAGRALMAALFEASNATARFPARLPNGTRGYPPLTVIDGAGQAGSSIAVRGGQPGQFYKRGDLFNIVHAGRLYLHMVAGAGSNATGSNGKVVIPIWPMLRFLTADGDRVDFTAPRIEGRLTGVDKGAGFARNRAEPHAFTITERE